MKRRREERLLSSTLRILRWRTKYNEGERFGDFVDVLALGLR